ncbi:TetR-like C-terminal domain-containing protein [Streptomyces avermitilis]|uniref:TetR-like C-terminal domain-containing protein n=1 Tax=Streptomyces avermitilis TaxID=33903 RepID=UPI00370F7C36
MKLLDVRRCAQARIASDLLGQRFGEPALQLLHAAGGAMGSVLGGSLANRWDRVTVTRWSYLDSNKRLPVPTEKPTAESIRGYLRGFARFLTRDPAGKVLLALIAEAQHAPDTAKSFHQRCLGPRRGQERDMLARGIDAGDVSPKLGLDATIDALVGPIVYCALTGASIPRGLVDTLVEDLLRSRSH